MTVLRGLVGVLVALAVTVGFVQFMELTLANAIAGHPLHSMAEYAAVLNTTPVLLARLFFTTLVSLLGGYLCAKIAEQDEMRYTLIAAIFRVMAIVGGSMRGYIPPTPVWMLAIMLVVSTAFLLAGGAVRAAAAAVERRRQNP